MATVHPNRACMLGQSCKGIAIPAPNGSWSQDSLLYGDPGGDEYLKVKKKKKTGVDSLS